MRLKGSWQVQAGLIPGTPIAQFSKAFHYTSDMREEDETKLNGVADHGHFSRLRAEAMDYYLQVSMPNINNWATITFIWY